MLWQLSSNLSVSHRHPSFVTFRDGENKIYFNKDQFLNFHDACQILRLTSSRCHLHIDKNIWLHQGQVVSIVIHDRSQRTFRFSRKSWQKYKRSIHQRIYHLMKHGKRERRECRLPDGKQYSFRSAMATLQSHGHHLLSRETTHAEMETADEWENCSNLSQPQDPNYRESEQGRGRSHASHHRLRFTPSPGRTELDSHSS